MLHRQAGYLNVPLVLLGFSSTKKKQRQKRAANNQFSSSILTTEKVALSPNGG